MAARQFGDRTKTIISYTGQGSSSYIPLSLPTHAPAGYVNVGHSPAPPRATTMSSGCGGSVEAAVQKRPQRKTRAELRAAKTEAGLDAPPLGQRLLETVFLSRSSRVVAGLTSRPAIWRGLDNEPGASLTRFDASGREGCSCNLPSRPRSTDRLLSNNNGSSD